MVYFEKSQPAPSCLVIEKNKASGDYKCGEVLDRLNKDFKSKCYICEQKEPTAINVEHFVPHKGNIDLKFDWNNLFWSCGHCNNTKLGKYDNILNCTDTSHDIENKLKYEMKPFPFEQVSISALDETEKTIQTKKLLLEVYNGTTKLKKIESANLRNKILAEIIVFERLLKEYYDDNNISEDKEYYLDKIKKHLDSASGFTAFKRWIIRENEVLKSEFEKYFI